MLRQRADQLSRFGDGRHWAKYEIIFFLPDIYYYYYYYYYFNSYSQYEETQNRKKSRTAVGQLLAMLRVLFSLPGWQLIITFKQTAS